MKYCHKCRNPWQGFGQPGTKEQCTQCSEDLHCCLNCRFYDTHKPNDCQVDTDPVLRKDRFNYCEEFQFADRDVPKDKNTENKARDQWKKLFGK
jgi:hypothetical protein